jgi:hypothetical protein
MDGAPCRGGTVGGPARDVGPPGWVAPSGVGSQASPPVGDKSADQVGAHREISLSCVLVLTGDRP